MNHCSVWASVFLEICIADNIEPYVDAMRSLVPFRDINVHASVSQYAFTSPSSPSAQTLVVDRPSGELRLNDGALLGAKRVSSIAGILGMIQLRLGTKPRSKREPG